MPTHSGSMPHARSRSATWLEPTSFSAPTLSLTPSMRPNSVSRTSAPLPCRETTWLSMVGSVASWLTTRTMLSNFAAKSPAVAMLLTKSATVVLPFQRVTVEAALVLPSPTLPKLRTVESVAVCPKEYTDATKIRMA